jgi:hypothetical protein
MTAQQSLALPYPQGYCEHIRWDVKKWPRHIKDGKGREWLVLHVGGSPYAHSRPVMFACHKPRTVEYHWIKDVEAYPV